MRSKTGRAARALKDIADQIALIERFMAGCDEEPFYSDTKTVFAVTPSLEIISEASRPLPEEVRRRHPGIPWKNIAGAGNVYRHSYGYADERDVW